MGALLFIGFNLSGVQWWIEEADASCEEARDQQRNKATENPFSEKEQRD